MLSLFRSLCAHIWPAPVPFKVLPQEPVVSKLDSLYVLKVDFPVTEDLMTKINVSLEPLRNKYGIDFLVLEPGISVRRFDEQ